MNTCKDCRHWEKTDDTPRWGYCSVIPKYVAADESPNPPGLTHRDFGCIKWEASAEKFDQNAENIGDLQCRVKALEDAIKVLRKRLEES